MNIYTCEFFANCPNNGARIKYTLRIEAEVEIRVESIVATVEATDSGFHEEIADALSMRFPGHQVLKAHHHGVDIETLRKGCVT